MGSSQIILVIETGHLLSGFGVSLQCLDSACRLRAMARGQLPANPDLREKYQTWKHAYLQWGGRCRLDPIWSEPANISFFEQVLASAHALNTAFNDWLACDAFKSLRQILYQELSPNIVTTLIVQTQDEALLRLPWLTWQLFDDFPLLRCVLAPAEFRAIPDIDARQPSAQVKILAVLAADASVDMTGDRRVLEQLPDTSLTLLSEPTRQAISDRLWLDSWDIFCFSGHSSSQAGQGKFTIAQEEWIQPTEIKFGLRKAAKHGLKLAIFNSCDGLAIAQDLVQNDVPFIITMREPVPDEVAQAFLNYFFEAYCQGASLFSAFQQAKTRLESIENQCPCATWLPVLMCNPTAVPPTWSDFGTTSPFEAAQTPPSMSQQSSWSTLRPLLFLGLILIGLIVRSSGFSQGLELWALDRMLQARPPELQDRRLLIVEIDEAYLQSHPSVSGSISDQTLNLVLQTLSQHHPRVIGVDIYRDRPLDPALSSTLSQLPEVIGVCKSPDPEYDRFGVASPAGVPAQRLGFSDILEDPDGVVRRQILFMGLSPTKTCATPWSFSSQLALHYLTHDQVHPRFSRARRAVDQHLILGQRHFYPIRRFWGGYQQINLGGNQILLNYRAVPRLRDIAPTVRLEDVLNHQVPESQIRNRLILIGVTANTTADLWQTPYASVNNRRIPGVVLQAHMASQMISAVQDERPLITALPQWGEVLLVLGFGAIGVFGPTRLLWREAMAGLVILLAVGLSVWALIHGLWLPLVPSILAFVLMQLFRRLIRTP